MWDERRPKKGMDTTKLDGRDHVTTWSESKKGQQLGLYVTVVEGQSYRKSSCSGPVLGPVRIPDGFKDQ